VRPRLPGPSALVLVLSLGAGGGPQATAPPPPAPRPATPAAPAADPDALLDRLESAWAARDVEACLALWDFATPELHQDEKDALRVIFDAEVAQLTLQRATRLDPRAPRLTVDAQVFTSSEPRGRVAQWRLHVEKRDGRFAFVGRDEQGYVDGLVHLSLDPGGYRAEGLSIRLEDFELQMKAGTVFLSPRELGPTVLVFAGEGVVRVTPRPPAERDQLRQFCGKPELVDRVKLAFLRLHPADLHRILVPTRLVPDPEARRRWDAAHRFYREHADRAFVLDTSLPGSPWWLLPSLGDAVVTFETRRRGTLTFGVAGSDAEDVTLFDRRKRLQICMYPSGGRRASYSEDEARTIDVLSHDLRARFDPDALTISGENTLRVRLLAPTTTLRLRLHDSFRVASVTSPHGGSHLFFRVRDQGSLVVSLGPYAGHVGDVTLTVRYVGIHHPAPIEHEMLQIQPPSLPLGLDEEVFIDRVLVYTNRTAWYPRGDNDDHATARLRFETPPGQLAVSGGELVREGSEGGRSFVEYRQEQPGKYITAAVGRFANLGLRQEGSLAVRGFGLPRTRSDAQDLMVSTQQVVAFLTGLFGPCPYPFLNLAVLEGTTPGGHSPPGMILIQQRPALLAGRSLLRDDPANFSDVPGFFLAHELAHQWWGQGVAPENYRERWLAEAWAQYAAALWVRETRGEDAFRSILERFARWAFRHEQGGPINLGHRLGHLKGDAQVFRAIVYDKGAYVIHMLRAIVGEDAFRAAVVRFLDEHRFSKAGTDDLREALEAASGMDLRPYFDAWILGTALPELRYEYETVEEAGGYRTRIEVRARELPGPVPLRIRVETRDGRRQDETVSLPAGGGVFSVASPDRPRKVELNEDRTLLARVKRGF